MSGNCSGKYMWVKIRASSTGPRQLVWTILWMTMLLCSEAASVNPHQPVRITWKLLQKIHVSQNKRTIPSHDIGPRDWVWVKRHQTKALKPKWKGPYVVLLTTPSALKVDGIGPWVHCNHVRPAASAEQEDAKKEWEASLHPSNPLRLKLRRRQPDQDNSAGPSCG